jgi:hypothetical protein
MHDDLLLVGSIPLETAEAVFRGFGGALGPHLMAMPDGEVGPRRHWISRVHYQVFAGHPDFEVLRRPAPDGGVERLNPRDATDSWLFKVRDGVDEVRFGEPGWRLGFARDAVNGYAIFRGLREKGVLARHLRFQVSLPSVNSVLAPRVFPEPGDLERIRPGFLAALAAELGSIVRHVPADDLAVQWDCATELQDAYGALPGLPPDRMLERNLGQVRALAPLVPKAALLGYHFCFGTLGGWPRFEPDDLGGAVAIANAFVAASGRRVDWIHIPVLDRADDAFFRPLAGLRPEGARIYLGVVHNMAGFEVRVAAARRHLPDFGLGAYCGFGRLPPELMPAVLDEHLEALKRDGRRKSSSQAGAPRRTGA